MAGFELSESEWANLQEGMRLLQEGTSTGWDKQIKREEGHRPDEKYFLRVLTSLELRGEADFGL
jgi:hypothetical protein